MGQNMKVIKSIIPTESQEQCAVIKWADAQPGICGRLMAIPNGAHKLPASAAKFKREGLRPGVPDLFLPIARQGFHGIWIEMKRSKGGVVSDVQADWVRFLRGESYEAYICEGADETILTIKEYMGWQ